MGTRIFLVIAGMAVLLGGLLLASAEQAQTPTDAPRIQLSSDPFPIAVGPTTLHFTLGGLSAAQVDGAEIRVASHAAEGGALTLPSPTVRAIDGRFSVPIIYPRKGPWRIEAEVRLAGASQPISEQFEVYVYPVSPPVGERANRHHSVTELTGMAAANPAQEYWIMIPQGAREVIMHGIGKELIPTEIRLQSGGRNTLVIRNDDMVDHNIGPFFVRAGETVRQVFRQPAVYVGTCSIRPGQDIGIVIE